MPGGIAKQAAVTVAALNNAASIDGFPSNGVLGVQISGTFSATITFEATMDGANWVAFNMTPAASATAASTATTTGAWTANSGTYIAFRARCSAYTSGSPVVTVRYLAL